MGVIVKPRRTDDDPESLLTKADVTIFVIVMAILLVTTFLDSVLP